MEMTRSQPLRNVIEMWDSSPRYRREHLLVHAIATQLCPVLYKILKFKLTLSNASLLIVSGVSVNCTTKSTSFATDKVNVKSTCDFLPQIFAFDTVALISGVCDLFTLMLSNNEKMKRNYFSVH